MVGLIYKKWKTFILQPQFIPSKAGVNIVSGFITVSARKKLDLKIKNWKKNNTLKFLKKMSEVNFFPRYIHLAIHVKGLKLSGLNGIWDMS